MYVCMYSFDVWLLKAAIYIHTHTGECWNKIQSEKWQNPISAIDMRASNNEEKMLP